MKGFLCFFRNLDTAGSALTKMAAISSPWRSPDVRMNAATPAFSSAIRSMFLYLIRWSLVSTTHSCPPNLGQPFRILRVGREVIVVDVNSYASQAEGCGYALLSEGAVEEKDGRFRRLRAKVRT